MSETRRVLVLGATGAMGQYLVPELAGMGYTVDAVSLDDVTENPYSNVTYYKANCNDLAVFTELLERRYDGVVNFMNYGTAGLPVYLPVALKNTGHYIFLSSYRAYDNKEIPVRESSPKCCDTADDLAFRQAEDYGCYKGRGEHYLRSTGLYNWTIVRPAVTYSRMRYQLVTLEAPNTVGRAFKGKPVVLPVEAAAVQGTMSWAGDVAKMLARLLFNDKALGEDFSVCTSEHHSWSEIAEYYKDICGLKSFWVPLDDYLSCLLEKDNPRLVYLRWQVLYDRLFTRIMDNGKILAATGLTQAELMPLYDGLKHEIARCPRDFPFPENKLMDAYVKALLG